MVVNRNFQTIRLEVSKNSASDVERWAIKFEGRKISESINLCTGDRAQTYGFTGMLPQFFERIKKMGNAVKVI